MAKKDKGRKKDGDEQQDATRGDRKGRQYRYDEERPSAPEHRYPGATTVRHAAHPGATARLLLEGAMRAIGGFSVADFDRLGVDTRDLVPHATNLLDVYIRYRGRIGDALLAIVREGPAGNERRIRAAAVAYLGELGFGEATEVLAGLATSHAESAPVRGLAVESLCRIGGDRARAALRDALADLDAIVRRRAARALAVIGGREDVACLLAAAQRDGSPDVRLEAARAVRAIHAPTADAHGLPDRRDVAKDVRRELVADANVPRWIGRHEGAAPQTVKPAEDCEGDVAGGRNLIAEMRDLRPPPELRRGVLAYEQIEAAEPGRVRLRLTGLDVDRDLGPCVGPAFRVSREQAILDLPCDAALEPGRPLPLGGVDPTRCPTWVPDAPAAPVLLAVEPDELAVWAERPFGIRVRFSCSSRDPVAFVQLSVQLPRGGWREILHEVSDAEREVGEVVLGGYVSAVPGPVRAKAAIYSEAGAAARGEAGWSALPTNPISMYVVPQTTAANGEGPAHYNASEDRFYCYARCVVTNGYPYEVIVGPTVTCRVTDGGSHVATFSFSIGRTVVAANSTRTLSIFTYHGSSSDVYDVFRDFGDVRMDFTIQTSEEDISGWHVWAAMAQIRLALNFVGDIEFGTRATFQSIAENEASAIYEQQSFYVSETRRFLLPRDHPDWSRYRDIRMNDGKDGDCQDGSDEADDLRDDWSSPTTWLDVWVVESFSGPACSSGVGGFSPRPGPTGKGGSDSGVVIQLAPVDISTTGGRDLMGIVIAHEVGHFLGLPHVGDAGNLMLSSTDGTNTDITHGQYRDMTDHGFVERFVP